MASQTPDHSFSCNHVKHRDKTTARSQISAGRQNRDECLPSSDDSSVSMSIYSGQTPESQRKLPKCTSSQTPMLYSHPSFGDCGSVLDGSVSGSSERGSLHSGIACPVSSSPSCHHAQCHFPPAHPRISNVQSQASNPCMNHHRTRQFKPVMHKHREEQRSTVKTRELPECENESSLGCCSFSETKSSGFRPQPQLKPTLKDSCIGCRKELTLLWMYFLLLPRKTSTW